MRVSLSPEFGLPKDLLIHKEQSGQNFSEQLNVATKTHLKYQMDLEFNAINEIGQRLCKNMLLKDLKEYRQRIAEFLKICISQGFSFKENYFQTRYGRSKVLSMIKIVNQKLIDLAQELLSENQDSLKVMALVDEISGLLLDIYA